MNDEQQLWAYIARLEQAIRKSMENSEEIAEIVARLQDKGVQVTINCVAQLLTPDGNVLEAPPGFDMVEEEGEDPTEAFESADSAAQAADTPPLEFGLDDEDRRFLDDLGLRLD